MPRGSRAVNEPLSAHIVLSPHGLWTTYISYLSMLAWMPCGVAYYGAVVSPNVEVLLVTGVMLIYCGTVEGIQINRGNCRCHQSDLFLHFHATCDHG